MLIIKRIANNKYKYHINKIFDIIRLYILYYKYYNNLFYYRIILLLIFSHN